MYQWLGGTQLRSRSPSGEWSLTVSAVTLCSIVCAPSAWLGGTNRIRRRDGGVVPLHGIHQPEFAAIDDDGNAVVVDFQPTEAKIDVLVFRPTGTLLARHALTVQPYKMRSDLAAHLVVFGTVRMGDGTLDAIVGVRLDTGVLWQTKIPGPELTSVDHGTVRLSSGKQLAYDGGLLERGTVQRGPDLIVVPEAHPNDAAVEVSAPRRFGTWLRALLRRRRT